jgi:hypothetical protein
MMTYEQLRERYDLLTYLTRVFNRNAQSGDIDCRVNEWLSKQIYEINTQLVAAVGHNDAVSKTKYAAGGVFIPPGASSDNVVVKLPERVRAVKSVLEAAAEHKAKHTIVLIENDDGYAHFIHDDDLDLATGLFLLESFKHQLFNGY